MTHADFMAERVHELEAALRAANRRELTLRVSRDRWRSKALAKPKPVRMGAVVLAGPLQVPRGTSAYNWKRRAA